jgi:fused signal recognition particle receptor
MFGFLKDKIKKAVKSISEKIEKKEVSKQEIAIPVKEPVETEEEVKISVAEEPVEVKEEIPEEKIEEAVEEREVKKAIEEEKIEEIKPEMKIKPEEVEELKPELKIEEEKEESKEEVPVKEKKGFFKRIVEKVVKPVVKKVVEKKLTEEDVMPILSEFETGMIEADVAYDVAEKIKNDLKNSLVNQPIRRGKENEVVVSSLRKSLLEILSVQEIDLLKVSKKPYLITFLGFNGSGKTTSMAKVASWLKENNKSCVFAAADTFRAAAEEQLEEHAKRIGVKMIKHKYGADPAAVIFDAVEHAKANGIDFVLADTAGRAHTNKNLMDQMEKIVRVNKPDMKILVIDSLTGNDALIQAQMFNEIGVDGLIFTKVDVNEKGGAILSVTHELKKPILFLGLGQEYKDFEKFDKQKFVNLLLS